MPLRVNRRQVLAGSAAAAVGGLLGTTRGSMGQPTATAPAGRKYQLGMVSYNIAPAWTLAEIIERCTQLGIAAVELRSTHAHGVEPDLSKGQREEVRKRFADSPVKLWGLGSACDYHSPDPAVVSKNIELTKRFVELAADVGARGVKVRPNGMPKEVSEERTLQQIGESLRTCGQAAADAGVEIWLEVHGFDSAHPPRIRRMMEIADHPAVGVNWNSNMTDLKDGAVAPYFELLRPYLRTVHINELVNDYPWGELFKLLTEAGYDRYTLIEILGPKSDNPEDAMRLLRYYKKIWEKLVA